MTANPPAEGLPDTADLQPVLQQVLMHAQRLGASQSEAALSYARGFSVSVRQGEVESLEFQRDRGLMVTVYFGQRKGNASTSDLSEGGIRSSVEAACAIARSTEEDACNGLADAERMARSFPELELDHPWTVTPEQAVELARECEAAALAVDARINHSEGSSLSTQRGISLYANSHGFFGARAGTQHGMSCAVVARDAQGMQRDYWYDSSRNPARLAAPGEIGRKAGQRTIARLGARQLSTRRAPVVFAPEVARGLFGHYLGAISGGALYRRASFLLDKWEKPVFSPQVRMSQQPFIPQGAASSAFDQEGVATEERLLVDQGVLLGWLLTSYTARKMGLASTGNAGGVYNLVVEPGTLDFQGMLREMGTGFLITELMGQGVNGVTGDYSRGAAGYWVEGGELAYPVEGVTVAGNLLDMYRGIRELGADVDLRSNVRCGSVLIEDMTVAGG